MSLMEKNGAAGREAERDVGERSEAAGGSAAPQAVPDPELKRPKRRSFSAERKLAILKEADACEKPGEFGALLRREGLYSSHLSTWRRQREQGALAKARKVIEVQGNVSALLEDLLGTEGAEESTER